VTRYTRLKARVVAHQAEGREVCLYSGCERAPCDDTLMCEHHTGVARRHRRESKRRRALYRIVQAVLPW
jgi:hypothetical protein